MSSPHDDYLFFQEEHYKVHGVLGKGGAGIVYKVSNQSGRFYACKVLNYELMEDQGQMSAFSKEAQIGINMAHEHLVSVHRKLLIHGDKDGHPERRYPAILMDFVDGVDMHHLKKVYETKMQRPFPTNHAILLLAKACSGLEMLHYHQIRHGDLKPKNILVSKTGYPKITDYGISTFIGEPTSAKGITGTLRYLAPEQLTHLKGRKAVIDQRTDIYALGIVALEMTAGLPRELYGPFADVARFILGGNRQLLAYVSESDLPKDLQFVIRSCLDQRMEKRPRVIRDLHNVLLQTIYGKSKGITLENVGDLIKQIL